MPATSQMLLDYPDILLQVLAELRGAFLDGADNLQQAVELLTAQITDPTSVQYAYQEVTDMTEQARTAVEALQKEGGELIEAQFSREYGSIRQMGPARLERESPWLYPENVAELLYYYGLIGRGFRGVGQNAHSIIYLPEDIIPWLPKPQSADTENGLPIQPVPAPPVARTIPADSTFLEDVGTLLGFIHTEGLRLTAQGPDSEDIDRIVQRFQLPFDKTDEMLSVRLALILHLAKRLGWLRRGDGETVQLTGSSVRLFLEKSRHEQRAMLWSAWRDSPEWNDLCRTPGLECAETGHWKNDPVKTRATVLELFSRLQPGFWYSQLDVIEAIKEFQPDFQRPTGDYGTWYIRSVTTQEFLKGFEQWDAVEGELLRFFLLGCMHWLGAIDLAEPSAGDDMQIALSEWGAQWMGHEVAQPHDPPRRPLTVNDDFTVTLAASEPLSERFRIERFAEWRATYPAYVYQITRSSLARAYTEGIKAQRVLAFLQQRGRTVPENIVCALQKDGAGL